MLLLVMCDWHLARWNRPNVHLGRPGLKENKFTRTSRQDRMLMCLIAFWFEGYVERANRPNKQTSNWRPARDLGVR